MYSTKKKNKMVKRRGCCAMVVAVMVLCVGLALTNLAQAEVRLSQDWSSGFNPDGTLVPDDQYEVGLFDKAAAKLATSLMAIPPGPRGRPTYDAGFRLFIDDEKYYIQGAIFMARSHPDEVCTPKHFVGAPVYECEEGQRLQEHPHLLFFNAQFEPVGAYKLRLNWPYAHYCNAMPALGIADAQANLLLVTVQCFNIERPRIAKSAAEIGRGWQRSTLLFRVKAEHGLVQLEQLDDCLGNPNRIETIPEARKKLKQCAAKVRRGQP